MAAERNRTLGIAVIGIALIYALSQLAYQLPEPKPAGGKEFSALHAQEVLKSLVGDGVPHPIGSEANARVRERVVKQLSDLGYEVSLQSGFACSRYGSCATPTNVIALRKGEAQLKELVLLAAHYDSVPAGPGASDDGLGVAAVIEIARILAAAPAPRHPIVLLVTDGEEGGLLGASLFVREHPLAAQIKAAVNLDGRGVSGASLMFETGSDNHWLMQLYGHAISRPITNSVLYTAYKALPNDTDFSIFKAAGMQGFNLAYIGDVGLYHTAQDSFANVDLRTLQHQGDNALASVTALAGADFATLSEGEGVYTDIFSHGLADWSNLSDMILALAAILICAVFVVVFVRAREVRIREIVFGFFAVLLSIALSVALAIACVAVARVAGRVPPLDRYTWIAHPQGMHLAIIACSALGLVALSSLVSKRAGFWGLWSGGSLFFSALALALAFAAPGVSFIALLPAAAALLAAVPCVLGSNRGPGAMRDAAVLAPVWVCFAALVPVLSIMYSGLGAIGWPLTALLLSLAAGILLPLLAAPAARVWRARIYIGGGVCLLAGLSVTLLLSTHSREWPLRINFEYLIDADAGKAHWIAESNSSSLRSSIAAAGHFSTTSRPRFDGSPMNVFFADAPLRDLPAPRLDVNAALSRPNGNVEYQLHLESARKAPVAVLVFPERAHINEVAVTSEHRELHVNTAKFKNGISVVRLNLPPQGVDLKLEAAGAFKAVLFDQSFELPGGEFLQASREADATSTQDGDVTVVQLTVTLDPAAGR